MTERTYTREDMARAWDEGHEDGAAWARLNAVLDGEVPSIDNPYREQGES
ncbi:hypothetical protein [Kocuria tytonis]|nr:hypothetical protein [Kocuria tytonis]